MYRFVALVFVFVAAACGGGDAPPGNRFGGEATNTATPSQQILGERTTSPTTTTPPAAPTEYTVAEGDTLSEIADKLGTTVDALVLANQLADADSLVVGQVLKISAPGAGATATPSVAATPKATPTQ